MLRALRGLGYAALLLTVFEACSGDDASTPLPPAGPARVEITGIALGQGFVGDGGASSVLACDYTVGVNVQTTDWTLLGPGRCGGALQCGQLRVSLLDGPVGAELLTIVTASNGAALDIGSLLSADPPLQAGTYSIMVELVDDLGKPYIALDGGNGSTQKEFFMALPATALDRPTRAGAAPEQAPEVERALEVAERALLARAATAPAETVPVGTVPAGTV